MRVRKARLPDAPGIYGLIAGYAAEQALLPRSLPEICEHIRDFSVVEIWGKSVAQCPRLHCCNETAMVLGSLPTRVQPSEFSFVSLRSLPG